jgi:hypothetical protein
MTRAVVLVVLLVSGAVASAADSIVTFQVQPFIPRRVGEKVPPPIWYGSNEAVPAGADVQIKVVQCPKETRLYVHQWRGGPVPIAASSELADLTAGKTLSHKAEKTIRLVFEGTVGGERPKGMSGQCKEAKRQDGRDVLTWSFGDKGDLVVEVRIVAP